MDLGKALDVLIQETDGWDTIPEEDVASFVDGGARSKTPPPSTSPVAAPAAPPAEPEPSATLAISDDRIDRLADQVGQLANKSEAIDRLIDKLTDLLSRPAPAPATITMPAITLNMPSGRTVETNTSVIEHDSSGKPTKVVTTKETTTKED
jgi:hypothetical protein